MKRKFESVRGCGSIIWSRFVPNKRRTFTYIRTDSTSTHRLKTFGMIQRPGNWVLLPRYKRNGFLHWWWKMNPLWQPKKKARIKNLVVYLVGSAWSHVLWVAQTERNHYWAVYRTQMMRLSRKLKEKRAQNYSRHDKIIILQNLFGNTQLGSFISCLFTWPYQLPLFRSMTLSRILHHMKIPKIG